MLLLHKEQNAQASVATGDATCTERRVHKKLKAFNYKKRAL